MMVSRPIRYSRAWSFSPEKLSQPTRKPQARYTLDKTGESPAQGVPGQGGHRRVFGALVGHLVVDLVGEHHQVVRLGDVDHLGQHLARIDRPGRVVGRDDDHGARARCHQARQFVEVRQPIVFGWARVVYGGAVGQMGGGGPQGIVGAGHQDLVPLVEQGAQREQDQLAHPRCP
jgi:hypothetical protein